MCSEWTLHRLGSFNTLDQHHPADTSSYYIRTLLDTSPKPLLLTPKSEVHALFVEIFETLGVHADFPDVWSHPGFDIGFQEEGSPRPRYLGRLTNNCSLDELEEMIPEEGSALEEPQNLEDWSFPAFRRKMEAAIEAAILAGNAKNRAAKGKKRRDRVSILYGGLTTQFVHRAPGEPFVPYILLPKSYFGSKSILQRAILTPNFAGDHKTRMVCTFEEDTMLSRHPSSRNSEQRRVSCGSQPHLGAIPSSSGRIRASSRDQTPETYTNKCCPLLISSECSFRLCGYRGLRNGPNEDH